LANLDIGIDAAIIVIGEADAGQPQANASNPVIHVFTDPQQMIDTFQTGNLAELARCAFDPALDGQDEDGVPIKGCSTVYAIKTNQSTQASHIVASVVGGGSTALTLTDRIYGLLGNSTYFSTGVADITGFVVMIGRLVAPNVGVQVSPSFGVTSVDEWLQVGITAAFTGASCTLSFDGTDLVFNSNIAAEDLTVTCTGKTMAEIIQEINAFAPIAGASYLATLLRGTRTGVLATYMDRTAAPVDIFAADKKLWGTSYDVCEWVNANSVYAAATWNGGYRPANNYAVTYLAGGTTGLSTDAAFQAALKVARRLNARFLVNAFDDDMAIAGPAVIALETLNGYVATHANTCNPIGGRSERQVFCCSNDITKAALYTWMENFNNEFLQIFGDKVYREGPDGIIAWLGAHCTATMAAAIMAGSPIGTPLTQKYVKCYDFTPVAADFDAADETDFSNSILKGFIILESDPGTGTRFAKGVTTYKTEDNDGHMYPHVVEEVLWVHRMLRKNVERPFVGHKGRGVRTANAYKGRAIKVLMALSNVNDPDVCFVEGTDDQGNPVPPFRNVRVWLSGDQIYLSADVCYAEGITFIFNELRATLPTALAS